MYARTATNRRGIRGIAVALVAQVARLATRTAPEQRHPLPLIRCAWDCPRAQVQAEPTQPESN